MRTIYLHVGLHKTGTTSIQDAFFDSRAELRVHDIDYFDIAPNHSQSLFPLFCGPALARRYQRQFGILSPAEVDRINEATEAHLRDTIEKSKSSRFVISAESLSGLPSGGVENLKTFLEPLADRIKVVAYVRDPNSAMASAFLQLLRTGQTEQQLAIDPPLPRYSKLQRHIDVFGRDRVDIRVFDPREFIGGDLHADFLSAIDASPELINVLPKRRLNRALSQDAAAVLNEINVRQMIKFGGHDQHRAERIARWLARLPGDSFVCPPDAYANARPAIEHELQWLHATLGRPVFELRPVRERRLRRGKGLLSALAVVADTVTPRDTIKRSSSSDFQSAP